jgi:2-oxoglutarate dehydrogenase E2 component (dihydrolipoamide succinyltransferase)
MAYIGSRQSAPTTVVTPPRPAAAPVVAPSPPSQDYSNNDRVEVIKMDRMRQIIAAHMIGSKKTSAHVTSFAEADVSNLVKLREKNKAMFLEREGIKLTYTPFFVHAAVDALREHPMLNSSVDGDSIIVKKDYHVGIAVAIGKTGLVVPVIKFAGHKNIAGLAQSASDLANRARNKQLQPDDLQGGTITVTNVGSLGSIMGTPIIAQPQVAIMATGAIKKRPVVIEDPELGDVIGIRSMMYISLSYDHRIIDGAMASSFLNHFVSNIEAYHPDMEV